MGMERNRQVNGVWRLCQEGSQSSRGARERIWGPQHRRPSPGICWKESKAAVTQETGKVAECTWAYLALLYNEGSSITSVCCRERPAVYGSVFGLHSRFPRRCEHTLPTAHVTPQRLLAHHWRRKGWPRVTVSPQGPCKGAGPHILALPPHSRLGLYDQQTEAQMAVAPEARAWVSVSLALG